MGKAVFVYLVVIWAGYSSPFLSPDGRNIFSKNQEVLWFLKKIIVPKSSNKIVGNSRSFLKKAKFLSWLKQEKMALHRCNTLVEKSRTRQIVLRISCTWMDCIKSLLDMLHQVAWTILMLSVLLCKTLQEAICPDLERFSKQNGINNLWKSGLSFWDHLCKKTPRDGITAGMSVKTGKCCCLCHGPNKSKSKKS